MTNTVTFYFMRHAETYLNKYARMQGWSNAPLTEKGVQDCQASGRGLAMVHFDAVYTSDLQRTKDTAKLIMAENKVSSNVPFIEKKEFREVFFGGFEGLPSVDVWDRIKRAVRENHLNPHMLRFHELNLLHELDDTKDAENYMAFWTRIEKGLYDLLQAHKNSNKNILVVSHGLAISAMLQGIIPTFDYEKPLSNASVSKVRYENGQFHLDYVNSTDHFKY